MLDSTSDNRSVGLLQSVIDISALRGFTVPQLAGTATLLFLVALNARLHRG